MTHANPPATPIATSKSAALARVLDLVAKGYTRYVTGQVSAKKAKALAQKFHERYGIGCSPAQRLTRKKHGRANAALVMYWPAVLDAEWEAPEATVASPFPSMEESPDELVVSLPNRLADPEPNKQIEPLPQETKVAWLLLVSPGDGAVTAEEKLASLLETPRLVWLGYELIRLPKRGQASWTWRRTKQEMAELYDLLAEQLNRRQTSAVAQTLLRISRQPGFSGVRQQSWQLLQFARSRGYAGELPFLFHIQKLNHGPRLLLK